MTVTRLHASCAAREGAGVLILGDPGAGKSDLLLRLLDRGFDLVADDQVILDGRQASPPAELAGLIEIRGLGILRRVWRAPAMLELVVRLGRGERLPEPARLPDLNLPLIELEADRASASFIVSLALDAALGRATLVAGAIA